jgi:hypothetical protein
MMNGKIIAVCFQNNTTHAYTLWAEFRIFERVELMARKLLGYKC